MSKSRATTTRAAAKAALTPLPLADMPVAPTHPGEIFRFEFREVLDPPVSQAEAARRLGWTTVRMNQFERGYRGVTVENAVALAELTGTSPEFWMNLQARHDLWHALKATKGKSVLAGEPFAAAK